MTAPRCQWKNAYCEKNAASGQLYCCAEHAPLGNYGLTVSQMSRRSNFRCTKTTETGEPIVMDRSAVMKRIWAERRSGKRSNKLLRWREDMSPLEKQRHKVGLRIRESRNEQGLSQNQLGVVLGLTNCEISKLEGGKRPLKPEELKVIAATLKVSTAWIEHGDPNRA